MIAGFSFAEPRALYFGVLGVVVVYFHLRRRNRELLTVSTLMFWETVLKEAPLHHRVPRLREWLSLLFHLTILGFIVISAAGIHTYDSASPRIFLIDRSGSMNASYDGQTAFQRGVDYVREAIKKSDLSKPVMILSAGEDVRVEMGWTRDSEALEGALDGLVPAHGEVDWDASIAYALNVALSLDGAKVYVISDTDHPAISGNPLVEFVGIGQAMSNVGITRIGAHWNEDDLAHYTVNVEVRSFASEPFKGSLDIQMEGALIDSRLLSLKPDEVARIEIARSSMTGGMLKASIGVSDSLEFDNEALFLLKRPPTLRVLVVGEKDPFLAGFLDAHERFDFQWMRSWSTDEDSNGFDTVIFLDDVPTPLPETPTLILAPNENTKLFSVGPIISPETQVRVRDHEITRHLNLVEAIIPSVRTLSPPQGRLRFPNRSVSLLELDSGESLAMAFDRPKGKVVVLSLDWRHGDLPLRTAFPVFLANALEFVSAVGWTQQGNFEVGTKTTSLMSQGWLSNHSDLVDPFGRNFSFKSMRGNTPVISMAVQGRWVLKKGERDQEFVVTPNGSTECDLRGCMARSEPLHGRSWVEPLLALSLLGLLAEWWHRRRR